MFAKTFRTTLVASTLVVAGSVLANPAMAQLLTDDVDLTGTVDPITNLTISNPVGALTLYGEGTAGANTVVKAADLNIVTNNSEGVNLEVVAVGGVLTGDSSGTLGYTVLFVADADPAPAHGDITATTFDADVTVFDVNGSADRDLYIQYDAPALLDPGNYIGTITVTIAPL